MVTNVYAKFPYGLLRIKKALGIFQKDNNNSNKNNNNHRSDLGPFLGPIKINTNIYARVDAVVIMITLFRSLEFHIRLGIALSLHASGWEMLYHYPLM